MMVTRPSRLLRPVIPRGEPALSRVRHPHQQHAVVVIARGRVQVGSGDGATDNTTLLVPRTAVLQAGWIVSDFKGQETVCGANGTWEAAGNTFTATMPKERHVRVSTRENTDWGA